MGDPLQCREVLGARPRAERRHHRVLVPHRAPRMRRRRSEISASHVPSSDIVLAIYDSQLLNAACATIAACSGAHAHSS